MEYLQPKKWPRMAGLVEIKVLYTIQSKDKQIDSLTPRELLNKDNY
jgi:hypothetical protein